MADTELKRLETWEEVETVFEQGWQCSDEAERMAFLTHYYYDAGSPESDDPFSAAYLDQVVSLYARITGRGNYHARENERTPSLPNLTELVRSPSPYRFGPTDMLSEFYISYGFVLRTLALRNSQSLLEYGPGAGQLALAFARNGCDVTVVDVEPAYIDAIRAQAELFGVPIHAHVGEFGDVPEPGRRYDAVLFFEAFHHALHHNELLRRLDYIVADDGRIAIAGEPIIEAGSMWEPTIPFQWGPRTDLLSLWSMRTFGWMELGFRESYFIEAAARAGWIAEKHECALTFRGNTWILCRAPTKPSVWARARSRAGRALRAGRRHQRMGRSATNGAP